MSTKLGHLLVEEGLLSEQDRKTIQEASGSNAGAFAKGVLALGLLGEDELAAFIADRTQFRVAAKDIFAEVDDRALGAIDTPLLRQLEVIPLRLDSDVLAVAMIDPLDRATLHQLEFFTGYKIKPLVATLQQIRSGLTRLIPGYNPEPSAFEIFMKTHMISPPIEAAKSAAAKSAIARELVARVTESPAPVVEDLADAIPPTELPPEPAVAEDPVASESDSQQDQGTEISEPADTPAETDSQEQPEINQEITNDNPTESTDATADPAADETAPAAEPPEANQPLKPDFGVPPAVAGNETLANKALLTLNKRAMDVSVDSDPTQSLKTLVNALVEIGFLHGCILVRFNDLTAESGLEAASWFDNDSAANLTLGAPQGANASELFDAIANYAPESMDSDGWLQIKAEDAPTVAACLDLFAAGEQRPAIESGLTGADTILMARAFKLVPQDADMVVILNWSMESAGHEALRASTSNALRAFGQKVPKK